MTKPKKWTDVYPQGTKVGDEEQQLFIALVRHPIYSYRSISALVKESGLSEKRVEEILDKYFKKGMVFPNPESTSQWGYWERNPKDMAKRLKPISEVDKKNRLKK